MLTYYENAQPPNYHSRLCPKHPIVPDLSLRTSDHLFSKFIVEVEEYSDDLDADDSKTGIMAHRWSKCIDVDGEYVKKNRYRNSSSTFRKIILLDVLAA